MKIKCLSIRQPWAWLIVNGHKSVENRDWATKYRGPFLIHASGGMTNDEYDDVKSFVAKLRTTGRIANPEKCHLPHRAEIERGGFVGIADLIHVVHERDKAHLTERDKPWFFGEYGFILENQRPLPFTPFKARLGLFDVELTPELENAIQRG